MSASCTSLPLPQPSSFLLPVGAAWGFLRFAELAHHRAALLLLLLLVLLVLVPMLLLPLHPVLLLLSLHSP
jgi:hypothetical protein